MTGLIIFIGVLILGYIIVKKMDTSHVSTLNNSEEDITENNDDKVQETEKEKEPEPDYYVHGNNFSEEHKGIIKCSNIKSAQFLAGMLFDMFGYQTNDKVIITRFEVIDNKTISVVYLKNK
jgi:hypothetical protein